MGALDTVSRSPTLDQTAHWLSSGLVNIVRAVTYHRSQAARRNAMRSLDSVPRQGVEFTSIT